MKKLERPQKIPKCLRRAQQRKAQNWERFRGKDRRQIWEKLHEMQGQHCAYCESEFSRDDSHIEHFFPRAKFPELTFDWNNLFGSCNNQYTCGVFKDGGKNPYHVRHKLLIKPDEDDPQRFFRYYKNGRISVKNGLSDANYLRAKESIKAFNLNHPPLTKIRQRYLEPLQQLEEEFMIWCDLSADDRQLRHELKSELRTLIYEQIGTVYQSLKIDYIKRHLDLLDLIGFKEINNIRRRKERQRRN